MQYVVNLGGNMQNKIVILFLSLLLSACSQLPDEEHQFSAPTSREYKVMLAPNPFNYGNEKAVVKQYFQDMKATIEFALKEDIESDYTLSAERSVIFYDTPGHCELKNHGYSFRERIKAKNGKSKVSLKYRDTDLNKASIEDVSSSENSAKTKFELDMGMTNTKKITSIYSVSTKLNNKKLIEKMAVINGVFPAFHSRYQFKDSLSIAPVSGLKVYERVYQGMSFNLGDDTAEVSLSIWYKQAPSTESKALVVEASFVHGNKSGIYSSKTLKRAKDAFYAMQEMKDWTAPNSQTKTQFIYHYDPTFCASESPR